MKYKIFSVIIYRITTVHKVAKFIARPEFIVVILCVETFGTDLAWFFFFDNGAPEYSPSF